jgi:hypothetical protein
MTLVEKDNYSDYLRNVADTVLYEEALSNLQDIERNKTSTQHASHTKNSLIYSEFWRREKAKYYFQAYNIIQDKHKINF